MAHRLDPVQLRRLVARTLAVALDGGPARTQLLDRWARAEAPEDAWFAALTWDGIGAGLGWALQALELRDVVPPEVDTLATDAYEDARRQCVSLTADLTAIGAELAKTGIPAIALKGSALLVGNVAPSLGVRWMSDIDVLIPETQAEQATWAVEALGYERKTGRGEDTHPVFRLYHESFTSPSGRALELHWRLGPVRWGPAADAAGWFARAEPSSTPGIAVPAPADLFWHLLLHDARNHAWSSGALRSAFDLALVARSRGFALHDVLERLDADPQPGALLEAIGDAAHLSPILAAEIEPSVEPRYLRLARWRDVFGRRRWDVHRVAEAVAWGATFDRARRYGGWRGVLERGIRVIPEAVPGGGVLPHLVRVVRNIRHAGFVGMLAAAHFITLTGSPRRARRELPSPEPRGRD